MTLTLYNSLSRKKQPFKPLNEQRVTLYVCGPTVYNRVHIGNGRPAVVFDTLFRLLNSIYPNVIYARNITDIDDKIIKAANERGEEIRVLSQRYAEAYRDDMQALNNLPPSVMPYATQHIPEMIQMVETLIERGHAYAADSEAQGHVLFAIESAPNYGELSGRSLDDMMAGARVEIANYKRYAGDFVLWKPSLDHEPGWDSPWGRGRPGWHLECSAMIKKHLGETIDIHGGGQDLIFPHHENEIAQSCCVNHGKPLANFWVHNGFINIDGEKMSKSLGNFYLVRDLLQNYPGEALRYAILTSHYRSEQNFGTELLDRAKRSLDALYGSIRGLQRVVPKLNKEGVGYRALLDDLNSPIAISELHRLAKQLNKSEGGQPSSLLAEMLGLAGVMGLLEQDPEHWFTLSTTDEEMSATEIEQLISARQKAKRDGDYAVADQIRQRLLDSGVILEDSRAGTQWRRK